MCLELCASPRAGVPPNLSPAAQERKTRSRAPPRAAPPPHPRKQRERAPLARPPRGGRAPSSPSLNNDKQNFFSPPPLNVLEGNRGCCGVTE